MMDSDGTLNVAGAPRTPLLRDLYHRLISGSWLQLLLVLVAAFFGANALFALAYLAGGNAIENARPGSYADAYFFSVQTLATIGYGKLAPATTYANVLVAIESFLGLLGLAIATGLIFAKFSRPTARVLFSRVAVVGTRDGVRSLMLRIANERASQLVEAAVHAVLVRNETTVEGESVRRFYDLKLTRRQSPIFALSWTVVHPITESSPLAHATAVSMASDESEILVSVIGLDAALNQTIHARHDYAAEDIVWNARFADILGRAADGRRQLALERFHETTTA
jgi:inward rectifier potassium channel